MPARNDAKGVPLTSRLETESTKSKASKASKASTKSKTKKPLTMKKILLLSVFCLISLVSLNAQTISNKTFTVNGVSFTMVYVQGSTFIMGGTPEQRRYSLVSEEPAHSVTLSSYMIGQTEVTQSLWEAVMGDNPSYFTGDTSRPVEMVSWDDCQTFITKLNSISGEHFRLPTEAEWEFAARGGMKSKGYMCSGSNDIDEIAWYDSDAGYGTHPVGTKKANELGIYDMSGNVWEWCNDLYGRYFSKAFTNPTGPENSAFRVFRGGCWFDFERFCRVSLRGGDYPGDCGFGRGLRLAMNVEGAQNPPPPTFSRQQTTASSSNYIYTVNGVSFTMIYVNGGTFTIGATSEQETDAYDSEKPAHSVTLSSYMIGETEVTQSLWQAVMGNNPSHATSNTSLPVVNVSWDDCQTFITKLNSISGEHFRLPTEAEWEFAARGGTKSCGYKYSGSNNIDAVAWSKKHAKDVGKSSSAYGFHPVGTKKPNELGIYDLSGNVWEWCNDWHGCYSSSAQTNPQGPANGSLRVNRGGRWSNAAGACRVSYRGKCDPEGCYDDVGLRLAL